ncbi:MAG: glycosyltransferase [Acidimicrobiia bacterium]
MPARRFLGRLAALFAVLLTGGVVTGVLVTGPLGAATSRDVDSPTTHFISSHFASLDESSLNAISWCGSLPVTAIVALAAGACFAWASRSVAPLVQCCSAFLGAALLTVAVRLFVTRPQAYGPAKGFPSGHVLLAVTVFGLLVVLVVRSALPRAPRLAMATGLGSIAVAVACARLLLLDHVLSDVVVSIVLGSAWVAVVATIPWRRSRTGTEVVGDAGSRIEVSDERAVTPDSEHALPRALTEPARRGPRGRSLSRTTPGLSSLPSGRRRRARRARRPRARRSVLIIVQNLPVPFDRRVWLECRALAAAGYDVAVVCPKGPGDPSFDVIDGVALYKYPARTWSSGAAGFVGEYAYSFAMTARLVLRRWRARRFDALQTCNPPDIFWPLGIFFRLVGGTRFVFDHHDLCPELYESRFPGGSRSLYWGLRLLERCTHHTADHVIATNASYREIAIARGGKDASEVTIVRTGPNADQLRRRAAKPDLKRGRRFLVAYIGVMGPQDGVDIVIRAADVIVHTWGREDISFTLMGSGDCFDDLVRLRADLALQDYVQLTGRVPDDVVADVLSTAEIGLSPDPKNALNDVSTMNKTMEYMAFGLPVVAFDLRETRVSARAAAVYAQPNKVGSYAESIVALLDDEPRRKTMGAFGRARIVDELAWNHQAEAYVRVYDTLLGHEQTSTTIEPLDRRRELTA